MTFLIFMDRLTGIFSQFLSNKELLSIHDVKNNKSYHLNMNDKYISSKELSSVKLEDGSPLMQYDPGYQNTIICVHLQ